MRGLVRREQFDDGDAPGITRVTALLAAAGLIDRQRASAVETIETQTRSDFGRRAGRAFALGAEPANKALSHHTAQGRGQKVILEPHVAKARDGRGSAVGVQCRQHKMARQRRLDRDLRGLQIADFADHDDVGIMPQDGAQQGGEGQPDLRLHLDLSDAREAGIRSDLRP